MTSVFKNGLNLAFLICQIFFQPCILVFSWWNHFLLHEHRHAITCIDMHLPVFNMHLHVDAGKCVSRHAIAKHCSLLKAGIRCNSASWHHRGMLLVSRYMFFDHAELIVTGFRTAWCTQHHQQCQQQGPEPLQGVTQLPDIVEGWSWCPDICIWPCWVDWNRFQNCPMYTNTTTTMTTRVTTMITTTKTLASIVFNFQFF